MGFGWSILQVECLRLPLLIIQVILRPIYPIPLPPTRGGSLRNRTGEERRRQTLCDKRDNNSVWKNLPANFTFLSTDLFVEELKTTMVSEFPTKHASNSPVTFVTHKRFAVLFFLPSCCVNSRKNWHSKCQKLTFKIPNFPFLKFLKKTWYHLLSLTNSCNWNGQTKDSWTDSNVRINVHNVTFASLECTSQ